jgi:hypothetical protein
MRTYQQPTKAVNQWHIGSESAFSGDQAAYISSDNSISSGFQLSEISRAYMEIPVDLTYCLDPHLFFQWKTDTSVLYGHGELVIMGYDQTLTIKPFTRSDGWQEYSISLKQFKGEKIILRYAWMNDSVKHHHIEPSFCIDDIAIFSPISPLPVNDSPIIAHIPDLTTMAGDNFLYTITTFDPTNDALTLTVSGQPEWLKVKQTDDNQLVIFGHCIQKINSDGNFLAQWKNDQIRYPYDIARLNQNIVISNQGSNEIIVFNKSGNIQYRWGEYGHNNGQFISPAGITVDADGHIYVADQNNSRIQKFTSTGAFLLEFNDTGVLPGKLFMPGHIEIDKEQLFVCEPGLNRIQMFQKVPFLVKQKAIIIAGTTGKSDSIWNEVNYVSQYVKRVLHQKGFASDQIFFMSNNTQSESLMSANFDNYQKALQWASDADYLIVCLVDHGGKENFSINGFDALSASKFSEDLNKWQSDKGKQFFVFYDACKSGSFVDSFNQNKNNRIIITSTNDNQKTYFSSEGLHSFSNYFWSNISSGADIKDAFDIASRQFEEQHPQIDSNNNGIPNENEDLTELPFTNIGNVSKAYESISAFKEVTATINSQGIVIINASLLNHMKLTRVWAEIKPPDQNIADSKQINVPSFITCEMNLMDNNIYQGHSDLFFHEGHYQIIVYGLDHTATLVNPTFSGIDIGENVQKKKAALIGGYATDPDEISFMQTNIQLAYNALIAQGYYDEDIRIFSSNAINIANIQTVPLSDVNVLKNWIGETSDITVYLTGKSKDSFMLTESNYLSSSQLNDALSNCDQSIVIIDSAIEQQYLENLSCENRIIVSSMNDLSQYAFSGFFWNNIQDGFTINKAFESAQSTFTLVNPGQKPIINIPDGGILSKNANIGMGVSYVPGEILTSSSIEIIDYILTADITSQEAIFCVFAKISY